MKTPEDYGKEARSRFLSGYNCTQSVLGLFCEELGLDIETALRIASPFGGGFGRQREVCGAVSGMCMALGLAAGHGLPKDREEKAALYAAVQTLCVRFRERNGSIVCREMLSRVPGGAGTEPTPSERTAEYYKKRPCGDIIASAAEIFAEYAIENGWIGGETECGN